ncbi:hypothetical protein N7517_007660 [Penicillium concentricum]|uniref:Uncharacterized protein n=1 Tax=Penicillium concentricum TaxID=293559 RepID=A0A9W9VCI0_9EURO|nr:uncharacterized protein N7517_007660 [Penicillium concentricum]KAJ5375654.1 hypothetical protein N7517_007660 [Penicillium concentricum]
MTGRAQWGSMGRKETPNTFQAMRIGFVVIRLFYAWGALRFIASQNPEVLAIAPSPYNRTRTQLAPL